MALKILVIFLSLGFSLHSFAEEASKEEGSSQELSLKQDRQELDQLRKDVPEDVKRENDDMAFILKLFEDKKRSSSKIRQQFNKVFNRTRKKKQKEFKKERNTFTKAEKKARKKFIADAKKKRKEFLNGDPSKEKKKEFFEDERTARKEYFSDEKEKRKDFESDIKARRKEFDDFMKDRRKDFEDRMNQFKKDQKELREMEKKMKKARDRQSVGPIKESQMSPANQKYMDDFDKIPKKGGSTLAPKEEQ